MSDTWEKLNLKDQRQVVVVDAPPSFQPELESLEGVRVVDALDAASEIELLLAFVTLRAEIENIAASLAARAQGDPVSWFAYPKGSSKRCSCDFDRDTGWQPLGDIGFEAVRQVAADEDWSALRFRRVEHIRSMRRDPQCALTKEGRARTSG